MTRMGTRRVSVLHKLYNEHQLTRDTKLGFNQVRATALILLNYKYGPTRRLGVNVAIIDHIRHSPIIGVF